MSAPYKEIKGGGVTSAQGYVAAGVACGIKSSGRKDLALVISTVPAQVAGTFTTNQVKAAPVKISMKHARNGTVRGVVLNAGNANACTGLQGLHDAKEMVELTAAEIGCKASEILVCSTGRIGRPLPMEKVRRGIKKAAKRLMAAEGAEAAKAIMTSDTFKKEYAVRLKIDGCRVTVGGMAKGAGMIHPKMATMLCVVTTDAKIGKAALRACAYEAVEQSFNRILVDGDTSTNDTVIVMANGMAHNHELKSYHPQMDRFQKALQRVMRQLARMIVRDGEGTSKMIEVNVKGAASNAEAQSAALAIAKSPLVKTAWCGGDPNWGRLMSAIGSSEAKVKEELVEIYFDGVLVVANGVASNIPVARLKKIARKPRYTITVHLRLGSGEYSLLTTDLTEEYVAFNKAE